MTLIDDLFFVHALFWLHVLCLQHWVEFNKNSLLKLAECQYSLETATLFVERGA